MSTFLKITALCLFLTGSLQALPTDPVLDFADTLFGAGDYDNAITEYKRYIFFNPTSDLASYAHYKIGLSLRSQLRWEEAIAALQHSIFTAPSDSIREEMEISKAVTMLASGDFSGTELKLLRLELNSDLPSIRNKAFYYRGVACLYAHKWEHARKAFRKYFSEANPGMQSTVAAGIDSVLAEATHARFKSPKLAKVLSTFLPGSGQIYSGDINNGINALAINAGTGYLLVGSLIQGSYANAFLSYFFLFNRYYFGNRHKAEKAAELYNTEVNTGITERSLNVLMDSDKVVDENSR